MNQIYMKGDIVLFPFPYTNLTNKKIRPCLVISNEMGRDIVLCQITSKNIPADIFSVELKKTETLEGTIFIDSYIRANMIFTADKSQIIEKICKINHKKYKEVIKRIIKLISK